MIVFRLMNTDLAWPHILATLLTVLCSLTLLPTREAMAQSKSTIIRAQSQKPISEAEISRAKPRMPLVSKDCRSSTKSSKNCIQRKRQPKKQ